MNRLHHWFTCGGISLALLAAGALVLHAEVEEGFKPLFNGQNLEGWQLVSGKGYVAEGGVLICPAKGGGTLYTTKQYADFILRFEFKLEPGSNNGVAIRAPLNGNAAYVGMEIQIIDNSARTDLRPTQYHGSIYDVVPAKRGALKPVGQWNAEEIIAKGRHITVRVNGQTVVDANLDELKDPAVLKKHPGLSCTKGYIGFLGHGTRVEFRNIRIKELR